MTPGNRPTRVSCAVAALTASVLALAASCGGSSHRPPAPEAASQLVARALGGRSAVRSGQVELSLSLLAPSIRESFTLHSATRFRVTAAAATPTLALSLATLSRSGSSGPQRLTVALASGPHGISLSVQGHPVHASPQVQHALQAGYAQLVARTAAGHGRPIAPPGLDAAAWLVAPRFTSSAPPAAGNLAHVHAGLALTPFLADVARLATLAAGLGRAAGIAEGGLQPTAGRPGTSSPALALSGAAAGESGVGTVDLLAERSRGLPRSLAARVSLHPRPGTGHSAAAVTVSLRMSFSALGEPARAGAS